MLKSFESTPTRNLMSSYPLTCLDEKAHIIYQSRLLSLWTNQQTVTFRFGTRILIVSLIIELVGNNTNCHYAQTYLNLRTHIPGEEISINTLRSSPDTTNTRIEEDLLLAKQYQRAIKLPYSC